MDFAPDKNIKPSKGQVLLAEPFLNDPYFKRTVIFLCEHNHDGSFGFEGRISIGGPVRNSNLYYLHTLGEKISDSVEIIPGVFMGGNFDILKKMLFTGDVKKDEVRFFVGYSGWSPEQLENEIQSKSWFVANASKELLMNSENNDLWKTIMKSMGKKGELIANLPDDPSLN